MVVELVEENIWYEKYKYDDAECNYYENKCGGGTVAGLGSLANQIAKAREEIKNSLVSAPSSTAAPTSSLPVTPDIMNMITKLNLKVESMEKTIGLLTERLSALECSDKPSVSKSTPAAKSAAPQPKKEAPPEDDDDDDDDVDLFGSSDEEEDKAVAKLREERLAAYAEKKTKKPGPIAKSSVLLDCKPWDDETDMEALENVVRGLEMDGLRWGAAKLVPIAYGVKKLSILCIVEDEKVSIEDLIEKITDHEDYVQSVDIAAFNKI